MDPDYNSPLIYSGTPLPCKRIHDRVPQAPEMCIFVYLLRQNLELEAYRRNLDTREHVFKMPWTIDKDPKTSFRDCFCLHDEVLMLSGICGKPLPSSLTPRCWCKCDRQRQVKQLCTLWSKSIVYLKGADLCVTPLVSVRDYIKRKSCCIPHLPHLPQYKFVCP